MKQVSDEVLVSQSPILELGRETVALLKRRAARNRRRRIRLCAHQSVEEPVHEMIIVQSKGIYIRPHKHLDKIESFHVIDGSADIVVFTEEGKIDRVIPVGRYGSGRRFYYRMSGPSYHTVIVRSPFLVFHETTRGPFSPSGTVFPAWAPDDGDVVAQRRYQRGLMAAVADFRRAEPARMGAR
jgi:cupin fold WbuC family metalloprotein